MLSYPPVQGEGRRGHTQPDAQGSDPRRNPDRCLRALRRASAGDRAGPGGPGGGAGHRGDGPGRGRSGGPGRPAHRTARWSGPGGLRPQEGGRRDRHPAPARQPLGGPAGVLRGGAPARHQRALRHPQEPQPATLSRRHPRSRSGLRHRARRHRKDLPGRGGRGGAPDGKKGGADHPLPPGGGSGREARLPARGHGGEGRSLFPSALRRALPSARPREGERPDGARRHRDCPPGLHARTHPEQLLRHPG